MRRVLVKTAMVAGLVLLLSVLLVVSAKPTSMLLDRFWTVEIDSRPVSRLGFDAPGNKVSRIRIDELPMSLTLPNNHSLPLELQVNTSGNLIVRIGANSIALGPPERSSAEPDILVVKAALADRTSFRVKRSILSWPTPLDLNFMTGHSASWKRHLYYQLIWQKQNGDRLDMRWRYEQYFYDRWASGFMTHEGTTGLIQAEIRPTKIARR